MCQTAVSRTLRYLLVCLMIFHLSVLNQKCLPEEALALSYFSGKKLHVSKEKKCPINRFTISFLLQSLKNVFHAYRIAFVEQTDTKGVLSSSS